jgi:hypothetical protein
MPIRRPRHPLGSAWPSLLLLGCNTTPATDPPATDPPTCSTTRAR